MQLWILKTNKLQDALKGAGGSVRALALYLGPEPWLASAGLDRFLRVHNASSKASKARVYLKQQLSAVVWLPLLPRAPAAAAVEDQEQAGDTGGQAAGSSRKKQKGSKSKGSRHRQGARDGDGADGEGQGDVPAEQQQSKKRRKHNKVEVSD
jgi:ribosome biogenesis protein NSA1